MLSSQQGVVVFISRMPTLHPQCLQLLLQPVVVIVEMGAMMMTTVHHIVRLVIMARRIIIWDHPLSTVITIAAMRVTLPLLIPSQ